MNNIIIGRNATKTALTQSALNVLREDYEAKEITIETSGEFAYVDAKLAADNQIKVKVDGKLTKPSNIKLALNKAIFLFGLAKTSAEIFEQESKLLRAAMAVNILEVPEAQLIDLISSICNTEAKKAIIDKLERHLAARNAEVKSYHTFNYDDKQIEVVDLPYGPEAVAHAVAHKGISVANSPMAGGKTSSFAKPYFDHMCDTMEYPLWGLASRALAGQLLPKVINEHGVECTDPRFYTEAVKSTELQAGLVGVLNTCLMSDDLKRQRKATGPFMLDEIEECYNHLSGGAIGDGSLYDMADINKEFDAMAKRDEPMMTCDAMTSQNTIDRLKKTGKKIYVYPGQGKSNPKAKIHFMTEAMVLALAMEEFEAGNKVIIFCDGSNSGKKSKMRVLETMFKTVAKELGKKYSIIDSNFMQDKDNVEALRDINTFTAANDLIIYNSAANCGLSITDSDYKKLFVIGCKTVAPNELIQSFGRPRACEDIFINIDAQYRKPGPVTPWGVLCGFMLNETIPENVTQERQAKMFSNPDVLTVLERIAYKNRLSSDYINTTVIMLQQMGYDIEVIESDNDTNRPGKRLIKAAEVEETIERHEAVIAIDTVTDYQASKIKMNKQFNSQENKDILNAYEVQQFFHVDKATPELMEFTESSGISKILKMRVARGVTEPLNAIDYIEAHLINKFFELTGMDPITFGDYHTTGAEAFCNYVETAEFKLPGDNSKTVKLKYHFNDAFPFANITARPMSTVKSILTQVFGLDKEDIKKNGKTQGNFKYLAKPDASIEHYYSMSTK